MVKLIKEHTIFCLILCLCLVLRIIPLFSYQFTYDELSGLERTQFNSFFELIEKGVKIDAHPAFVQLLIFYLVKLVGYQTWIIKLPFLLFSFAAVIYAYAIGIRNFSKQAGLFLAIVLSFSQVFVFYAPIARMYITGVFFSLALLYYFLELVFKNQTSLANYFLFGLFALLSGLNHHMNALFAITLFATGFIIIEKQNFKIYLLTGLLVAIAYLPHLYITLYQLSVGGIGIEQGGWLDKPEWVDFLGFIKLLLGTGKIYLCVLALIVASVILNKQNNLTRIQWVLISVFLINYFIIYFYSVLRFPIYQHSVMLFSGMALLIFTASFIKFETKPVIITGLSVLGLLLIYRTYISKNYFNEAVKTVYEYQFERTIHYKSQFGEANVYPVFFDSDSIMKKIYFEKYAASFDYKASADTVTSSMKAFSNFVSKLTCNYLVLASALPAQQAVANQYFPYLIENTQTQGINYCLYSKLKSDKVNAVKGDKILAKSNPSNPARFIYSKKMDKHLLIDSLNEYPFDTKEYYFVVAWWEGNIIQLKAKLRFNSLSPKLMQACINVSGKEPGTNYGYAARPASDFVFNNDSTITIYADYFVGTNHKKIKKGSKLGAYIWNIGKENAELLSFEVSTIDYWHNKWHYWD